MAKSTIPRHLSFTWVSVRSGSRCASGICHSSWHCRWVGCVFVSRHQHSHDAWAAVNAAQVPAGVDHTHAGHCTRVWHCLESNHPLGSPLPSASQEGCEQSLQSRGRAPDGRPQHPAAVRLCLPLPQTKRCSPAVAAAAAPHPLLLTHPLTPAQIRPQGHPLPTAAPSTCPYTARRCARCPAQLPPPSS